MATKIEIRNNNGNKTYDLDSFNKEVIVIGRSRDNDIVVDNVKVSGHHGCFYKQKGNWYYQDMNSTNGSMMNGFPVVSTPLLNGSKLVLDSKQWPDSCCISVKVEDTQFINQQWTAGPNIQQNNVYSNMTPGYINGTGYTGMGAGYGGGTGLQGMNDAFYSGYNGNGQVGGIPNYPRLMNMWGYIAATAWSVVGIVALVNLIRSFSIFKYTDNMMKSEGGFILLMLYLMYVITALGTIILPIAMFTVNKKSMATSSDMIAAGYAGIFVTLFILIAIAAGDAFGYLFQSTYFVMLLASMVLFIAGLISLSRNFKKNYKRQYINNSYTTPIICISIAWILIFIIYASLSKDYSNIYGNGFSLFSSLPNGSIWLSAIWFAAIIFSCVYLHVDELENAHRGNQGGNISYMGERQY
ncbi:MAG: FHA domain-containing protein [Eubacterium sp.]|nr:FHA domain-containing protein [Eubacterium sp.]